MQKKQKICVLSRYLPFFEEMWDIIIRKVSSVNVFKNKLKNAIIIISSHAICWLEDKICNTRKSLQTEITELITSQLVLGVYFIARQICFCQDATKPSKSSLFHINFILYVLLIFILLPKSKPKQESYFNTLKFPKLISKPIMKNKRCC